MSTFEDAFTALVGNEGGYTVDNGGSTMWGVTEAVARANGYHGDMHDLPIETAKAIAKAKYWDPVRGDELPAPLAFQVFDASYNSGPSQAVQWLQKAMGVPADGKLGPITMAALQSANIDHLVERFNAYRLLFLADLSVWPNYGKGWARRIANNLLRAAT